MLFRSLELVEGWLLEPLRHLKGEAKPEDMPIKHLSSKDLVVVKNDEMAEALGIDLSALDA